MSCSARFIRELLEKGSKKVLLKLYEVGYIDSSGLGELVKTYSTVQSHGGQLKLVQPSKRVAGPASHDEAARGVRYTT